MTVEVKRKQGESSEALARRFSRRVLESGVVKEVKKRRFRGKTPSKRARKISALRRKKNREYREYLIRIGVLRARE